MKKEAMRKWRKAKGDYTHRLEYDLNENSLVLDVGGYEGWFADQIYNKFGCNVLVFEPVKQFSKKIFERFEGNKKVEVLGVGLSNEDKWVEIFLNGDATSTHVKKGQGTNIHLMDISNFLDKEVDLMKLNIEGEEFPILQSMIDRDLVRNVKNIQVQFHDHIPNAIQMRNKIIEGLSKTHKCTWNYEFIWENWERK